MSLRALTVYCGSSTGTDERHRATAAALGEALGVNGIELVYGGGHVGLMGVIADAALSSGATVTGVITQSLLYAEVGHRSVTELITVDTMHERKMCMSERGDAFVMLPGGYGTLDEFFEAVTWTQLGIHTKPCAVLDPTGYYDGLMDFVDRAVTEGFVSVNNRSLITSYRSVDELLRGLQT
jgi:uncharacterized protein (TIGR00730 family)